MPLFPKDLILTSFSVLPGRRGDWPAFVFGGAPRGLREPGMLRGMKWLIGALLIAGGVLVSLNGICAGSPGATGLSGFFCPQLRQEAPRVLMGPREPLKAPAGSKSEAKSAPMRK